MASELQEKAKRNKKGIRPKCGKYFPLGQMETDCFTL